MKQPHHRVIEAKRCVDERVGSADPLVNDLVAALTSSKKAKPEVVYALEKFKMPDQRVVLDALHLGGATEKEIEEATGMPLDAIRAYAMYIFDMSVFKDQLDRRSWVKSLQGYLKPDDLVLLQTALVAGVQYIVWMFTGKGEATPTQVLRTTMNDAHMRSMAHRMAGVTTDVSKAAHDWAKTAERTAKTVAIVDPQDTAEAREEIRIALRHRDDTVNEEITGITPDKILH